MSDTITKTFKTEFNKINPLISKSKVSGVKKLKAETISPEEAFDLDAFTDTEIDETTSTGSVGGSYVAPLFGNPIKKSSLFAPEGTKEHEEGKKILKRMEKPIGKFTKKDIKETFLVAEDDIEETTTTGGVGGSYVTTKVWAKDKENWRGNKKLYPGGKFVHIKDKCKKYPYCNQSPEAIELTDRPKDKLSPVFEYDKKNIHDMYDDEIYSLRNSEYLKLIEIIESVNKLTQYPSIKKLWELFQKKFDGYLNKQLIGRTDKIIKDKYSELTHNQEIEDDVVYESDKNGSENKDKDYKKVLKTIKSVENSKQINTAIKTMINFRLKYDKNLSEDEIRELNDVLHSKIEELSDNNKEISENVEIKTIHRKIIE